MQMTRKHAKHPKRPRHLRPLQRRIAGPQRLVASTAAITIAAAIGLSIGLSLSTSSAPTNTASWFHGQSTTTSTQNPWLHRVPQALSTQLLDPEVPGHTWLATQLATEPAGANAPGAAAVRGLPALGGPFPTAAGATHAAPNGGVGSTHVTSTSGASGSGQSPTARARWQGWQFPGRFSRPGSVGEAGPTSAPTATHTSSPTTAAPAPKPASSSGSSGSGTTGCVAHPSACGYPDASNTGASGTLTASGSITSTTNGQVIKNLDIHGFIAVTSANVTIENVKITATGDQFGGIDLVHSTGHTTITNVTIVASSAQLAGITARDATITRANISGGQDGIDSWAPNTATGATVIEDSYIHDLARNTAVSSHDDTIQTSGGDQTIKHNTLIPFTGGDPMNACLQIGDLQGDLVQLTFTGNLCDGGNYSINANGNNVNLGKVKAGPLTFTNNRFGRDYRYGVQANLGSPFRTTWTGNIDDATGKAV
jgi:hypothetical protein